jgi:hypothetical protein
MKNILLLLSITALIACKKSEPFAENSNPTTTTPAPQQQHAGFIEFDLTVAGTVTHYEYHIDSVKTGGLLTQDSQGNDTIVMFFEDNTRRILNFRYFDTNGDENSLSLSMSLLGSTNSIAILHSGDNPYAAQTNTSIPLCNTSDFEINITSPNEATFAGDYLYNFYNDSVVDLTNGHYIMY